MNTDIIEKEDQQLTLSDDTLIAIANQAEKRVEAMNRIKKMALKLTNSHDWVDENGKPYLQASGAEKVARLFGISWRISEPILENLEGGHFSYTYKGEFSLSGATIEAIGTRSSKDGFFKKYKWADGEKIELPASEIDRGDVKKAAYTNLIGNGITRLLGIRNLTYDDLKEYAGISKDQITAVQYKKGGNPPADKPKAEPTKPAPPPAPTTPPASATPPETNGKPTEPANHKEPAPASHIPTGKVVQNVAEFKRLLMSHKIGTKDACSMIGVTSLNDIVDLDDAWERIKQAKNI